MVRSKNKHVCNPGARRAGLPPWKRKKVVKPRIIAVEQLPLDYVPEKLKPMRSVEDHSKVPRKTITCGNNPIGPHTYNPKTITHRKIDYTAITDEDKKKALDDRPLAVHVSNRTERLPEVEIVPYVSYGAATYKN